MKEKIKNKAHSFKTYYKKHPKRFWVGGILILIILAVIIFGGKKEVLTAVPVTATDLTETVLATGQVTSQTDLNLSFSASDTIRSLPVVVGQKVAKGQVLATLDNRDEYASLAQANASLKSAQARYQKVVDGNSSEEVAVSQAALASAQSDLASKQKTQDTLVANAQRNLLNADLSPVLSSGTSTTPPTVTGTYTGTSEGSYVLTVYGTAANGGYFSYTGIESGTGDISTTMPVALGTNGLYIQFPANTVGTPNATWTILLPNTKSSLYLAKLNAYQEAQKNRDSVMSAAQSLVNERQADLNLKKAAARPADLAAANADILSAQAQVETANVAYENTILRAPASGTIVKVDTKLGERTQPQQEVMVLQDVTNLYVEANINESNIAKLVAGQKVSMTFDAFGPDKTFTGSVIHIDPSATTTDGVVNYKIKTSIDPITCAGVQQGAAVCPQVTDIVRPGMNANIIVHVSDTPGVIAIPEAAITRTNGKSYVEVITNAKRNTHTTREVVTGASGDGNLIQITNGLTAGETIALIQKAK